MIWFSFALWPINHCCLFNSKSVFIHIKSSVSNMSVFHKYAGKKQFYFKLFSQVNKVKWFQVLLCITNNSIKHQSFIYTHLNQKQFNLA